MPNWQPNWNNVRWDWGAASAAASSLRRAADKLDATAQERQRAATEAQREWRGRYREEFDEQLRNMLRRATELAAEFRYMAHRIEQASQNAWAEQRHRESERRRWHSEKRKEEERERRRREEERQRREEEQRRNQG